MNRTIEAIYERGVLRPVEPLQLQEGESVRVVVMGRSTSEPAPPVHTDPVAARAAMDRIAALPPEGPGDGAPVAREHDRYLYGDLSAFQKERRR